MAHVTVPNTSPLQVHFPSTVCHQPILTSQNSHIPLNVSTSHTPAICNDIPFSNSYAPVFHPQQHNPPALKPHKWNLSFNGTQDPVTFLERLEEICEAENISPNRLLPYIPDLLRGEAAMWFRNNKYNWRSWREFRIAFREFYFPVNYEVDLEAQISRRLQKPNEPTSRYITELQTLIRRHGNIDAQTELNWLYRNLLPEFRQYIRRNDFQDTASFCKLARKFEILHKEVQYS